MGTIVSSIKTFLAIPYYSEAIPYELDQAMYRIKSLFIEPWHKKKARQLRSFLMKISK